MLAGEGEDEAGGEEGVEEEEEGEAGVEKEGEMGVESRLVFLG